MVPPARSARHGAWATMGNSESDGESIWLMLYHEWGDLGAFELRRESAINASKNCAAVFLTGERSQVAMAEVVGFPLVAQLPELFKVIAGQPGRIGLQSTVT
jgi:hypothetical protein